MTTNFWQQLLQLETLIWLGGLGQIILCIGSLSIPKTLGWPADTAKLQPLTRQVFWTYAGYILGTNFAFGLLSFFAPESLLDGSILATAVSAFITLYWAGRVLIQFFYFDRSATPPGRIYQLAEAALVGLFVYLTAVYGAALLQNLGGM